jgi:hypothetical protein
MVSGPSSVALKIAMCNFNGIVTNSSLYNTMQQRPRSSIIPAKGIIVDLEPATCQLTSNLAKNAIF